MRKNSKKVSAKKTIKKTKKKKVIKGVTTGRPKLEEFRFLRGEDSLSQETWRVFRIVSEFIKGLDQLYGVTKAVSVFGSARIKPGSKHYKLTEQVGYELAKKGFAVLTGGGPGAMEAANKGAQRGKCLSIGLGIKLPFESSMNKYIDKGEVFNFFFVRKVMLVKYAHGFIITPGGLGTLDELFEALTLKQTGKVDNFPVILLGKKYWSGLMTFMKETLLENEMIKESDLEDMYITDSPKEAAEIVERYWKRYLKQQKSEIKEIRDIENMSWKLD